MDEKRNAKVRYVFSIVPDKKSSRGRVVVCHCSACNDTIEAGSYPSGAEQNGISNVNKHRDTASHKFFVENAAGRKGENNTVAAELFKAAEAYAGKDVFLLKEGGHLKCRLCKSKDISLFGQGSAMKRIEDHVNSSSHKESKKKSYKSLNQYFTKKPKST